jgi:CheY-like chemotaxis protein
MTTLTAVETSLTPQRSKSKPQAARSTRVLLVEDEPLTAEVFARALSREGHLVEVARDGLQAIRRMREQPPSLVVLDMSLPAVSGADVVRDLRQQGGPAIPVVVVSGSSQDQCELTDADLSPGLWLTKPIKPRHLVEIVRRLTDGESPS